MDEIAATMSKVQTRQAKRLVELVMPLVERQDLTRLADLDVPYKKDLEPILLPVLERVFQRGYDDVQEELKKQGLAMQEPIAYQGDDQIRAFWRARVAQASALIANRLHSVMSSQALSQVRVGVSDPKAMTEAIMGLAETVVRRYGRDLANETYALGRAAAAASHFTAAAPRIRKAVFSAMMDSGTCDACAAMDGQEFQVGDSGFIENEPPYRDCEGCNNCRCLYIYLLEGGLPEIPKSGMPKTPLLSPEAAEEATDILRKYALDIKNAKNEKRRRMISEPARKEIAAIEGGEAFLTAIDEYAWTKEAAGATRQAAADLLAGAVGPDARANEIAETFVKLIAKQPVMEETLYRGMWWSTEAERAAFMAEHTVGGTIDIPLASATLKDGTAEHFMIGMNPGVKYEMESARGLPISAGCGDPSMDEVLTSGRFEVVSIEKDQRYKAHFDARPADREHGIEAYKGDTPYILVRLRQVDVFEVP